MSALLIGLGLPLSPLPSGLLPKKQRVQYDVDAVALWEGYRPSALRKRIISDTFVQMKDVGVFEPHIGFYVMAGGLDDPGYPTDLDREFCRRNWRQRSFDLTEIDGVNLTFITDVGFQGNGLSSALDTNFIPSLHGGSSFTANSGSVGFWSWTSPQSNNHDMGAVNTQLRCRNGLNRVVHKVNAAGVNGYFEGVEEGAGLFVSSRTGTNLNRAYKDGILLPETGAPGIGSTLDNRPLWILGANDPTTPTFSIRGCQLAHFGAGLTDDQVRKTYEVFNGILS